MELPPDYVPGRGPLGAKLVILGEAPSVEELRAKEPFVGPSGRELDRLLKDAGVSRQDCWITNVCKRFVPPSPKNVNIPFLVRAKKHGIDIDKELSDLRTEINSIEPNCILALGGTALWGITGKTKISNYRGSILRGLGNFKCVPTYHPAHLLHQAGGEIKGYWNRTVMVFDIKRAYNESRTSEYNIPSRYLHVCRSSWELEQFRKRHRGLTRPALDIEALDCIPTCIGIAYTPSEGISVPLWNLRGISEISDTELVRIRQILAEIIYDEVIGQNFKYDQDKIRRLAFIIRRLASDTMLKAFAINPELPKSLAFNTSIYTREPYYKDEGSDFDITKQSLDDLFLYNARDACVTKEIDLAMDADLEELGMRDYYENFILPLHDAYLDIENEGFHVDETVREVLISKYVKWSEALQYELFQIVGDYVNVNSPLQMHILLYKNFGLPLPAGFSDDNDKGATGEEIITGHLNSANRKLTAEKRRALEIILEKRRVDKTIGNYLMALPDFDGKMKTTYYLCLETGRTSTGQQEPPIRPVLDLKTGEFVGKRKKGKKYKQLGAAFQVMTKHGDIGQDVRSMYVPEKGHVLIAADSAQAEARVVFLLADDEEALHDIDAHDYHALTASWFFGGSENDYSKKALGYESPIRFAGKTLRHAGHLGAGKRRAATELNTQARKYKIYLDEPNKVLMTIDEKFAGIALDTFHRKQPKIRGVFHNGIISHLEKSNRRLTAPVPFGIESRCGGVRTFFERWGDELFRQAFSYIPQRAISDNTKGAILRLRKREPRLTRVILEAHDGILFTIPEREVDYYTAIIKEEMERPIRFDTCSLPRRDLIVPCELEFGYDYMELSKLKGKFWHDSVEKEVVNE